MIVGHLTAIDTEWSVTAPPIVTLKLKAPVDFERMCALEEAFKLGRCVKLTVLKRRPRSIGTKP